MEAEEVARRVIKPVITVWAEENGDLVDRAHEWSFGNGSAGAGHRNSGYTMLAPGRVLRRLSVKAKKHSELVVLAESKLNTIADHVSTALTDGQISDDEFRMVIDEVNKYTQMKAEIRT